MFEEGSNRSFKFFRFLQLKTACSMMIMRHYHPSPKGGLGAHSVQLGLKCPQTCPTFGIKHLWALSGVLSSLILASFQGVSEAKPSDLCSSFWLFPRVFFLVVSIRSKKRLALRVFRIWTAAQAHSSNQGATIGHLGGQTSSRGV